jgi:hypothetical protein
MSPFESFRRRIRDIEEDRGAGGVNLTFSDGSKQSFSLNRNDRLKVLLACFDIARAARNPEAKSDSSPRAREIATLIATAQRVTPESRLWSTIAGTIQNAERNAEEDKRDSNKGTETLHSPQGAHPEQTG